MSVREFRIPPKNNFWGLVQQKGPWRQTPQDRYHAKSKSTLWRGGGVQGGGTEHAGNAGWYSMMNPATDVQPSLPPIKPSHYATQNIVLPFTAFKKKTVPGKKYNLHTISANVNGRDEGQVFREQGGRDVSETNIQNLYPLQDAYLPSYPSYPPEYLPEMEASSGESSPYNPPTPNAPKFTEQINKPIPMSIFTQTDETFNTPEYAMQAQMENEMSRIEFLKGQFTTEMAEKDAINQALYNQLGELNTQLTSSQQNILHLENNAQVQQNLQMETANRLSLYSNQIESLQQNLEDTASHFMRAGGVQRIQYEQQISQLQTQLLEKETQLENFLTNVTEDLVNDSMRLEYKTEKVPLLEQARDTAKMQSKEANATPKESITEQNTAPNPKKRKNSIDVQGVKKSKTTHKLSLSQEYDRAKRILKKKKKKTTAKY